MPENSLIYLRPAVAFGDGVVLFLVRRVAPSRLARRTAVVAGTLRIPAILWVLAASLAIALRYVHLAADERKLARDWIVAFLIVSLTLAAATAAVRALTLYGQRHEKPFVVGGLSKTLTYVAVWSVGAVVLLNYLELDNSVAPLLTALGVGGLAVALALQDTLTNFFAGIHIPVEEPISVGDFIRLLSHEEGVVADFGWRTRRVLTKHSTTIVIPNTKITSSILGNYGLPDSGYVIQIPIRGGLTADPDLVARIAIEGAHAVWGLLPSPAPALFFDPGVTLTHIQFRLADAVQDKPGAGSIQPELRVALPRRFRSEGVPLPEIRRIELRAT